MGTRTTTTTSATRIEETQVTCEEMVKCLDIFDQTIGCNHCGQAWWAENFTAKIDDFHADDCPLKGRRDIHEMWGVNYPDREDHRIPDHASP